MAIQLKGRSYLTNLDFTPEELRYLMDYARELKAHGRPGNTANALLGKNIVLIYEKPSARTRQSFQVLAEEMGAHVTYLDPQSSQFGKKESLADTARVLGRFYDAIQYRGTAHQIVEDLAKYSGIPVWSGLTDIDHPTTIRLHHCELLQGYGLHLLKVMAQAAADNPSIWFVPVYGQ